MLINQFRPSQMTQLLFQLNSTFVEELYQTQQKFIQHLFDMTAKRKTSVEIFCKFSPVGNCIRDEQIIGK